MNLWKKLVDLVRTGTSVKHYYRNMNMALRRLNEEFTMLHFPMEGADTSSFIQSQKNLTDFCVSLIDDLQDKHALEIGCGNGIQAMYINTQYKPASLTGIDLDPGNIEIAKSEMIIREIENMRFFVDDAQKLEEIETDSMDVVINIESAFHYPDKAAFLNQIARVLKPGGTFVIADLLTTARNKGFGIRKLWKRNMILHHWEKKQYEAELGNSNLDMDRSIDITGGVIRGFRNYRDWIRDMKKFGFLKDLIFKIFYIINVQWTLYCLRYRREYFVFVGNKPIR
jgi:ubiquinone/menaquinone biosynthesis C-methylase UbiE